MNTFPVRTSSACDNCGALTPVDGTRSFTQGPPGRFSDHTIELCPTCAENADWTPARPVPAATNQYDELEAETRRHIDRLVNAVASTPRINRRAIHGVLAEATKRVHLEASQGLRTWAKEPA